MFSKQLKQCQISVATSGSPKRRNPKIPLLLCLCPCVVSVVMWSSVRLLWYLCGCGGYCDACTVVCVACVYAESVRVTVMLVWLW